MVRRLFPRLPQARLFLHRSSRQVHSLEAYVVVVVVSLLASPLTLVSARSPYPLALDPRPSETVLYLGDMITVKANDSVSGTISIAPNATNPRDLDIVLDYKLDGESGEGSADKREYRM
jgi:hypothetical protein